MSVKTLKLHDAQNPERRYDALIREKVVPGSQYSKNSIRSEKTEDGFAPVTENDPFFFPRPFSPTAENVIYVEIPKNLNPGVNTIQDQIMQIYLDVFEFAKKKGFKSIVTELLYRGQYPIDNVIHPAYRAAYTVQNEEDSEAYSPDTDITIAIDQTLQDKLISSLPSEIVVRKPINPTYSAPQLPPGVYAWMTEVQTAYGVEKIEVPDRLHKALLESGNLDPYSSQEYVSAVLVEYLEKYGLDKTSILKEVQAQLSKSTVYNAFDLNRENPLNKETVVYIALAMHLTLEETVRALSAAGQRFIEDDPIDIIYIYSIQEQLDIDTVRSYLLAEGFLDRSKE